MTGDGLLHEAVAELYSSDPDEFIARRGVLVTRAREAGDAPAAKRIAALRKPTRSAWVVNLLVRSAPSVTSELTALGDELRAAQDALDGPAISQLSQQRRQLIDALARRAFAVSGQRSPPAALRGEVTATLGAALADPQIAEQLRAGALERAARSDGFGSAMAPALTLVPPPSGRRAGAKNPPAAPARRRAATAEGARGRVAPRKAAAAPPAAKVMPLATARARAERERRRQAMAEAEQEMARADLAAVAAARAEQDQESAVRRIGEQLADAREDLAEARAQAHRAKAEQRQARRALDRLQKQQPPLPEQGQERG